MAVAPTVQNSTEPTTDELSPTTIILNALRKAGQQPTNENIRRYVEAMGRQPGQSGVDIPGLRVQQQDDGDPAVGRRGNVSTKIESVTTPPVRGGTPDTPPDRRSAPGTTSASPETDTSWLLPSALAGGGAGLGYYIANRGNPGAEFVGNAQPGTGRIMDVDPTALPGNARPQLGASAGPMPDPGALPPPPTALAAPQPSPMTQALDEATAPRPGTAMPDIGPVPQPSIPPGPSSPVLPADLGAPPPQTIPSGPNTQVLPQNMPENAPRVPMPNRVGAPPTPADFYHPSWRTVAGPLARAILGHGR